MVEPVTVTSPPLDALHGERVAVVFLKKGNIKRTERGVLSYEPGLNRITVANDKTHRRISLDRVVSIAVQASSGCLESASSDSQNNIAATHVQGVA